METGLFQINFRQIEGFVVSFHLPRLILCLRLFLALVAGSALAAPALFDHKTELFAVAIGAFLDIICETFNSQGIPSLIDINGQYFSGITEYPKIGISLSHKSTPSGPYNTGSPAKSRSIPIPSISCILRLKYHER